MVEPYRSEIEQSWCRRRRVRLVLIGCEGIDIVVWILVRVSVGQLLACLGGRGCQGPSRLASGPWGYSHPLELMPQGGPASAIEGYHGLMGDLSLANWASRMLIESKRSTLYMEPFIYAGPAKEVAAKCDNWLMGKIEADIAVEATLGISCS